MFVGDDVLVISLSGRSKLLELFKVGELILSPGEISTIL